MWLLHHLSKMKDMNNDITTEERIDNYLLGRMTDAEKRAFEQELAADAALREEFECQRAIVNAVQKVAMKEFLAKHAAKREEEHGNVIEISDYFRQAAGKVRDFFSSGQRVIWTLASAAAMVVTVVGSVNYVSTLHTMQANGMLAYAELAAPVARDGNELDSIMEDAYNLIGAGELDQAIDAIAEAKTKIQEALCEPVVTEEDEYTHVVLQQKLYDLEWYEAIVLMRKGKLVQARKVLNVIAGSDSPYANNAQKELKILFR